MREIENGDVYSIKFIYLLGGKTWEVSLWYATEGTSILMLRYPFILSLRLLRAAIGLARDVP